MADRPKPDIHPALLARAARLVDGIRFTSIDAVLEQGLIMLESSLQEQEPAGFSEAGQDAYVPEELAAMLRSRADGPRLTEEEFRRQVETLLKQKRRENGLPD